MIDKLRADLADAQAARASLQTAKKELLETIAGEEKTKAGLLSELEESNGDLADRIKDLATYLEKCQDYDSETAEAAAALAKAEGEFDQVVSDRKIAEADANNKRGTVDDLRKQLAAAEAALADAEIKLAAIRAEEDRLPKVIAALAADLDAISKKAAECRAKAKALQEEIDGLKNEDIVDLTNQIDEVESSILGKRQ